MTASHDPSTRYVLPADAPYLANLAALWQQQPSLARTVEGMEGGPDTVVVEASKSGPPTLGVRTAEGRVVALHSKYNPVAEGQKLVEQTRLDGCVAFYVLGLGLGYHVETLFERASTESIVFVFEPDLGVLRAALEHRDLSELIGSGRVYFFTVADKGEI